jgi:hypothetical protein
MRSVIRPLTAVLSATALTSCMDLSAPTGKSRLSLAIVPRFSQSASLASATLAQAGLSYNAVRIVIVRPSTPPDTLKDTTIVFTPTSPEQTLELSIAASPSEALSAGVQFKQDATVMFSGSADVKAIAPTASATAKPIEVVVTYTGPGSTAATVQIQPGDGLYSASSSTQFTAKAFDANNIELPSAPIFWSVSDPTKATISATGLLTPTGSRGTINVTATAANGIAKTVAVALAPGAAGLRVVQGAAQKGPAGSVLPLEAVIELFSADGLPAASTGQTVTFSASGAGASISPTSTTINSSGRASAKMTVGGSAGTTYIYTATVGTFSVSWGGTATPGTPTHFVTNGPTTFEFDEGSVPDPIPTVRLADASENSVAGVALNITVTGNGEVKKFQVPSDTVGLIYVHKISPPAAGSYTVLIEVADPALAVPSVTYNVTVRPGAGVKHLAFTQQPPSTVANGQQITIQVTIQDQSGATVTSAAPSNISLAIDPAGATGWSLVGTGSVAPVNGVATFTIAVTTSSGAKTGVKIQAIGANLPAVLSTAFNITP